MKSKVAIIGKAPSSRLLAPYDDDSWEIWSLSDNYNVIPRWDRWFEIHDLDRYKQLYPEYYDWMCNLPENDKPLYVNYLRDEISAGVEFPWKRITDRFGSYFNNTISWMLCWALLELEAAMANELDGDEEVENPTVGLWGVDMATDSEYGSQKPSCEYFMGWAKGMGFEVVCPDECDLLKTARLYGIDANRGPLDRKIRARQRELADRQKKAEGDFEKAQVACYATSGAIQELERVRATLNGQGTEWIEGRLKQLNNDLDQATIGKTDLMGYINKLEGAREDLKWCRQWA